MNRAFRMTIAVEVLGWFENALPFLAADNWTFRVCSKGKYLPGEPLTAQPETLEIVNGDWTLTFRALSREERIPHRQLELTNARETLHKVVTICLMNLIGSAEAGRWLKVHRTVYQLPVLRKVDIWGKQRLLFS